MILNVAAYRFVLIADPTVLAASVREACEGLLLKGSVLVAPEGINLFLAGDEASVRGFLAQFCSDERFAGMTCRFSHSTKPPFRRLRIKVKPEIITFGKSSVVPAQTRARAITPARLRQWLRRGHDDAGREVLLLDTRNREEVAHGTFDAALTLPIERFTQLPAALEAHRETLRDKTVVSFCTGGIRCEKAALWMDQAGYENVYQLDGGILGYFEAVGGEAYHGRCFVFDERVALDSKLQAMECAR